MANPRMFAPLKPTGIPHPGGLPDFGFRVGFVITDWFFNSDNVKKHLRNVEKAVLNRFGAYVRKMSRNSQKYVPANKMGSKGYHSAPYTAPHAHTKQGIRYGNYNIVYGYDPARRSVVIGPRKMPRNDYVPQRLEYGRTETNVKNPKRRERKIGHGGIIDAQPGNQPNPKPGSYVQRKGVGGKVWWVKFTTIKTERQLKHVNEEEEKVYGPFEFPQVKLEPRPYMRPAFWHVRTYLLPTFWEQERAKGEVYFTGAK